MSVRDSAENQELVTCVAEALGAEPQRHRLANWQVCGYQIRLGRLPNFTGSRPESRGRNFWDLARPTGSRYIESDEWREGGCWKLVVPNLAHGPDNDTSVAHRYSLAQIFLNIILKKTGRAPRFSLGILYRYIGYMWKARPPTETYIARIDVDSLERYAAGPSGNTKSPIRVAPYLGDRGKMDALALHTATNTRTSTGGELARSTYRS